MICPVCNGTGYVGMWSGHGGNEHLDGTMPCEECGGAGELNDESAS